MGSVKSSIKTELTPYGINNSLLKVYVIVNTRVRFIIPFVYDSVYIESEIPVIMKIINGSIPEVYGGNYAISSPINES